LCSAKDRATLEVADDGAGFDTGTADTGAGLGLRAMRDRMDELGGSLSVESRPESGTIVRALFPRSLP
jgi:signal transduction histidine kinase